MSSLEEWRRIALASLGLPDKRLLDVLKLVEQAPDRGQVRVVLDQIRPRLVRLRPPRPLTAQRLLFRPMEDLFDPTERYRARIGRLSRAIVQPCWSIVRATVDPSLMQRTEERVRVTDPLNQKDILAIGLALWSAAAQQISDFLEKNNSIGRHRVGNDHVTVTEDVRQQLLNISDILSIAPEIETAKLNLPDRPIKSLSPVEIELVSTTVMRLAASSMRKVQTFILLLLARMARPGDLLQALGEMSLPCSNAERAELLGTIGSNALSALASETQILRQQQNDAADPSAGAQLVEQLVARLISLERSLYGSHDHKVADQVCSSRREIANFVLDTVIVKADQDLFENLSPDAASEPTLEQMENAERSALSLRRCARVADAVGIRKDVEQKLSTICAELERRSVSDTPYDRAQSQSLMRSIRLIELIAGPDEAQRLLMARLGGL